MGQRGKTFFGFSFAFVQCECTQNSHKTGDTFMYSLLLYIHTRVLCKRQIKFKIWCKEERLSFPIEILLDELIMPHYRSNILLSKRTHVVTIITTGSIHITGQCLMSSQHVLQNNDFLLCWLRLSGNWSFCSKMAYFWFPGQCSYSLGMCFKIRNITSFCGHFPPCHLRMTSIISLIYFVWGIS